MSRNTALSSLLSLSCLFGLLSLPLAFAAEDSASLDSMWIDQEAPTIDKEGDSARNSAVATAGVPSTVAPMCSFDEFRQSGFITKGSWPGLGPFKASSTDISELIDDKQNRVKVAVKSEQITSAELGIGKLGSGNVRDLLDIEMAADFLLESLGAKPRKIAEFNKLLEKSKVKAGSQANLKAGRYQVIVDRSKSAQPYACLISVNSLDANKSIIAEHSGTPTEDNPPAEVKKPDTKPSIFDSVKKPANASKPKQPPVASAPSLDPKRDEFVAAIKSWQQVKKNALKKRDPSHLGEILGGVALKKQSTAVQWLQTHGNYYDMEPKGCVVEKYSDLGGGKKYSVVAQVREFSKYIRESDNAVLKEVDDKYTVNYTLEKQNDKWLITDSSVVTSSPQSTNSQAAKTPNKTR